MFYIYQIVKFFAWEKSFEQRILAVRELELKKLLYSGYIMTLLTFSWTAAPFLVSGKTGQDGHLFFFCSFIFLLFSLLVFLSFYVLYLTLAGFLSLLFCLLSLVAYLCLF